jgi:hypothetical protein
MMTWRRRNREKRDLHFLTDEGMVACNPRDREAAHRAEVENTATENAQAVTCKKCREYIRKTGGLRRSSDDGAEPNQSVEQTAEDGGSSP